MAVDLVKLEEKTLDFWRDNQIFLKSLQQTKHQDPYVFYDGPPFATGLPHHGHLTASTIKDIIGRYWTMRGKYVERNWGWDCHGLPIEGEIHKKLGMSAEKAIRELGVAGYNDECRSIVDRYTSEWQTTIERLGRWVSFENSYKTMDPEFMESVWWVFKQLWDKNLVYQGTKVMPFSTALGTPLSNFEAGSNYKDVQDPAITVLFKLDPNDDTEIDQGLETVYLAVWTTTPWTLPSNLALCVNSEIDYVEVMHAKHDRVILAESCLESYAARHDLDLDDDETSVYIRARYKGSELVGRRYKPLFSLDLGEKYQDCFRILADSYVKTDQGTGIVHIAPSFGEDDRRVMQAAGLPVDLCLVDDQGRMQGLETGASPSKVWTCPSSLNGQYLKEANKNIIHILKEKKQLLQQDTINHPYPHCPRTDTPLIYKAVPCWYIAVSKITSKLLAANDQTSWVPEHIKEGRFGSWLKNAQDWCVSRNRIWGTPIPIWKNDKTGKTICVGSRQNLMVMAGVSPPLGKSPAEALPDLHREYIDKFEFALPGEEGTYKRIPEIFDCWFESGSMPYAQNHHPFSGKDLGMPADFIAEGLDQTRGWFYTLTVLSAALYDKPAFKNVIVNGIVLAADGKKMSKRLKNYTDPMILLKKYGADALRLYLINSGLTKAEDLKFVDEDIKANIKSVILPWYNVHKFFTTYAEIDGWKLDLADYDQTYDNQLDLWLMAETKSLVNFINREMEAYRLFNIVPEVARFFDSFANTYVRLNRRRFWGPGLPNDKRKGYAVYFSVLKTLAATLAPIIPFLSEHLFQELKSFGKYVKDSVETVMALSEESVHLIKFPMMEEEKDQSLLQAVRLMQQVILLGRRKREQEKIEIKTPLQSLKIIHNDTSLLDTLKSLEGYIKSELNVKSISYHQDEDNYIEVFAKPNFKTLGRRLGSRIKQFKPLIESLTRRALDILEVDGFLILSEEKFTREDILVYRKPKAGTDTVSNRMIGIELDCVLTPALIREGLARKTTSLIQNQRKESGFDLTDRIGIRYLAKDDELEMALVEHSSYIKEETLALSMERISDRWWEWPETNQKLHQLDGKKLYLEIIKI